MGIRGLATFIARYSDKYLEDYKLKDCYLVIDGNSLACQLYANSPKFNSAFGGDYDRYATYVIEFFDILKKCKIKPLVIIDGGNKKCKLRTCFTGIKQKWKSAKFTSPMTQHRNQVFPCFLREVFKDVLGELHIPFAYSLFEADSEIAAIARCLKCPVLSYDSDFFVYDVLYIPFPTVHLHACKDMTSQSVEATYYLSCRLYKVENFLRRCGLQKETLPFLSVMLGCDYVGTKVYRFFVSNLKQKKSCGTKNRRQKRIQSLLEWLQTETFESAKLKVLKCLRKDRRMRMIKDIKSVMSIYTETSSDLLPILGIEVCNFQVETSNQVDNVIQLFEEQHDLDGSEQDSGDDSDSSVCDEVTDATCSSGSSVSDSVEMSGGKDLEELSEELQPDSFGKRTGNVTSEVRQASYLPEWFLDSFKQGEFPSVFMDMIILNQYFVPPQIEDYEYPSSHMLSLPIIAVIYGLMVGSKYKRGLRCHVRKHNSNYCKNVNPVHESTRTKFPSLKDLPNLSMAQRLLILIETAGLNSVDQMLVASIPSSWQLYTIALIFWARQSEGPIVNRSHIDALLLSLILLDVVGKNVICIGSKKRKGKKYLEHLHSSDMSILALTLSEGNEASQTSIKAADNVKNELDMRTVSEINKKQNDQDDVHEPEELLSTLNQVVTALESVNSEECVIVKKLLHPWYIMDEKLKNRPKLFCVSTVHSFAQFQSCLLHFTYLNALLGQPVPHCRIFRVFNGTFVYNMYNNLKQRTNSFEYMSRLLSTAPTLLSLFKLLRGVIENLTPKIPSTNQVRRKRKRKQRRKEEDKETTNNIEDTSDDTDYEDPFNRFAALAAKKIKLS